MIPFTSSELGAVLAGGDERTVRARALGINYHSTAPREGALAVAAVLLFPRRRRRPSCPNRWRAARRSGIGSLGCVVKVTGAPFTLIQWCTSARTDVALYPIFLFNCDFGDTRRIFRTLLDAENKPPPYHWLVLLNILHARLGLSHTDLHRLASGSFERFAPYIDALPPTGRSSSSGSRRSLNRSVSTGALPTRSSACTTTSFPKRERGRSGCGNAPSSASTSEEGSRPPKSRGSSACRLRLPMSSRRRWSNTTPSSSSTW